MLILIEQVLKQYWYVSRCANNELAPCILKLKNNTEWKQTTVTGITENRFGNFRFWGENMLDRFGFFSFSSPVHRYTYIFHGYSGISVVFRYFGDSCDPVFVEK